MASEIYSTQFRAHRLAVIEYVEPRTVPVDSEIHDQVHTLFHARDTRRPFLQMIALVYQDDTDLFLEILTLLEHYTDSFRPFCANQHPNPDPEIQRSVRETLLRYTQRTASG